MCSLVLLWHVLRTVGPEGLLWSACSVGVRLVGWRIFCAQVGAYFRARLGLLVCVFVGARPCCVSVFCLRPRSVVWSVRSGPMAPWRVLRTAAVCCVERIPGTAGAWRRGAYSRCGWACYRLWVYPVCYEVDKIPLCLILTEFFPPFLARVETSARKPLFFGYNAYAVGLMVGVRGP